MTLEIGLICLYQLLLLCDGSVFVEGLRRASVFCYREFCYLPSFSKRHIPCSSLQLYTQRVGMQTNKFIWHRKD